ncbi:MAG: hypothetical protein ACM3X4_13030 [Ignavibacteriales bacterium]
MFPPQFPSQFPRFSQPRVTVDLGEQRTPGPSWPEYQLWVWPYTWRKSSTNVTVLSPGSRRGGMNPAEAAAPAPPAEPPPPGSGSPAPVPAAGLIDSGGSLVEPPQEPPATGPEREALPEAQPETPQQPAPQAQAQGSLVWRIPSMRKGG